ncbi:MAG TPA: recombinase family protein [Thermoleophilia bacterium]|nr:recombinase family protein [Thermoleophilia bacterium]
MNTANQRQARRVATYERTSSEDQTRRETIKSQSEEIARTLDTNPDVELVGRYVDDGVSGKTPMAQRPEGSRLLADARQGLFDEVWVYKIDRLGRGWIDPGIVWEHLESYGVRIFSVREGFSDRTMYYIYSGFAAKDREELLARMAAGADRAAREARYTGGIRPYGYRVEGEKENARYVPSDNKVLGDMTEADVVRQIYSRLAIDRWTCWQIARELNDLGVPTLYKIDGREVERKTSRGLRKQNTQGRWTAARVRNMVVNPMYKGVREYGRRSENPNREIIRAAVPALVSEDLWEAAKETLSLNATRPKNSTRTYLLRTVMKCAHCGRTYGGSTNHGDTWYRCKGKLRSLEPENPCPSKAVKGDHLEPLIWGDVERWLSNPGDLLDELAAKQTDRREVDMRRKEVKAIELALAKNGDQRERLIDAFQTGVLPKDSLGTRLNELRTAEEALRARLAAFEEAEDPGDIIVDRDLLEHLQARLPDLTIEERQEIVRLLVREVLVFTEEIDGKRRARAEVTYRYPEPDQCVVSTLTDSNSCCSRDGSSLPVSHSETCAWLAPTC